jgi:hypothetical protein
MANAPQCAECRSILDEFEDALAEVPPESSAQLWSRRDAFMKLIGRTEEDAERLEELGGQHQFRPWLPGAFDERERYSSIAHGRYPAIQNAFRKMLAHAFRTGHWIGWKKLYGR